MTALIGDNGAGKSTLVKILSGVTPPTRARSCSTASRSRSARPSTRASSASRPCTRISRWRRISGPAENAYIGRELLKPGFLGRLGVLDKARCASEAFEAFTSMGTDVKDMDAPVAALSGGQRQSVAICRSVMWAKGIVFMDEPTAALGVRQTRKVLDLDPPGRRPRRRRRADQPQHAARCSRCPTASRCCGSAAASPSSRAGGHRGGAGGRHDRRAGDDAMSAADAAGAPPRPPSSRDSPVAPVRAAARARRQSPRLVDMGGVLLVLVIVVLDPAARPPSRPGQLPQHPRSTPRCCWSWPSA